MGLCNVSAYSYDVWVILEVLLSGLCILHVSVKDVGDFVLEIGAWQEKTHRG